MSWGGRGKGPAELEVGLLPALGGSIGELRRSGQHSRLIDGYLRPYAAAFDRVWYVSYAPERLADFTDDVALAARVAVLAPARRRPRGLRAAAIPVAHGDILRRCGVLRVFQVTGTIPAVALRARFGVPYVTTYGFWYGSLSRRGPKRLLKAVVERVGLRRAAAVIATTEELARAARRLNPVVELIPNGVDTQGFAPRPGPRAPGPRRVLYVGRLSPEKNLDTVIEAVAGAREPARLVMAGAGPLRDRLGAVARARRVDVEFLGTVDHARLPDVYRAADAFVLASFTEGHPKVLLEAMASGVPCAVSDCAGNRSLVADGETGLVFDPHRPAELGACLDRLARDAPLAARLAGRAREAVASRYELGRLVAREIELLRTVARRDGG